jgi:hypothetical protein
MDLAVVATAQRHRQCIADFACQVRGALRNAGDGAIPRETPDNRPSTRHRNSLPNASRCRLPAMQPDRQRLYLIYDVFAHAAGNTSADWARVPFPR